MAKADPRTQSSRAENPSAAASASFAPEPHHIDALLARLGRNLGILLGGSTAASLLGFATLALNARALGPAGLGVLSVLQSLAALLAGIFAFGTQQPLIRFGSEAIARKDLDGLAHVVRASILFDVAAASVAGLVGLMLVALFAERVGISPEHRRYGLIYIASVFLVLLGTPNGIFRLLNKVAWLGFFQIASALAVLLASAALWVLSAPLLDYVVAFSVIAAATSQLQFWTALRLLSRRGVDLRAEGRRHRAGSILREFATYSWVTSATGTIDTIRANADTLLVGAFIGPAAAGLYNVAKQLAGVLRKLATAASLATYPEVAALAAKGDLAGATQVLKRLTLAAAAVAAAAATAAALVGRPFLRLALGARFEGGYASLVIMTLVAGVALVGFSFGGFVQAFRSPVKLLWVYLAAILLYAAVAPAAIASFGIAGAASAQLAYALAVVAGCGWVLRSVLRDDAAAAPARAALDPQSP